jgi:hypothetical protein
MERTKALISSSDKIQESNGNTRETEELSGFRKYEMR